MHNPAGGDQGKKTEMESPYFFPTERERYLGKRRGRRKGTLRERHPTKESKILGENAPLQAQKRGGLRKEKGAREKMEAFGGWTPKAY